MGNAKMVKLEGMDKELVIASLYNGNYINQLKVKNNEYFNKVINAYHIFKTSDDLYFAIELSKPSIQKTLWFSDEHDIPSESEQLFIDYNIRLNAQRVVKDDRSYSFVKYASHQGHKVCTISSGSSWEDDIVRDVEDEELAQIKEVTDAYINDYTNRLKKYWNKYSDKVMTMGFWADR